MDTVRDYLSRLMDHFDNHVKNNPDAQSQRVSSAASSGPRKYRNETREYNISGRIESTDVNAITFVNRGTNTATVNSFILQTGESVAFEGLAGEIDATIYAVAFGNAGPTFTSSLVVFAKKY
jgi:hypothetical protein